MLLINVRRIPAFVVTGPHIVGIVYVILSLSVDCGVDMIAFECVFYKSGDLFQTPISSQWIVQYSAA